MKRETMDAFRVPLFFSRSKNSTDSNRTGNWSFLKPGYADRTAPCSAACPCGTDIPRLEGLAAAGRFGAAWRTILMENPLPGVTGRVCFHPCEKACNRAEFDASVSVNAIERFLADAARDEGARAPDGKRPTTGRRVAILGSGPAGLSAACFLARLGHACEVFETEKEAGGLLRWGIPAYRLPLEVLEREVAAIAALGVKFHFCSEVDPGFLLRHRGRFDAVFACAGFDRPLGLGVPGEELARDGFAYLREMRMESAFAKRPAGEGAEPVAVIGGGNAAIDVARSLRRQGRRVLIVYRRRRLDMPAFGKEVERALEEGVELLEQRRPLALSREGKGILLELGPMRPTAAGPDGRTGAEPAEGPNESLKVAEVYAAIGAGSSLDWTALSGGAAFRDFPRTKVAFGHPCVAIGGDLASPEKSVADAIASGKEAALVFDAWFAGGEAAVETRLAAARVGTGLPGEGNALSFEVYSGGERSGRKREIVRYDELNTDYFEHRERSLPAPLPAAASLDGFAEVERALSSRGAMTEAERCFSCGTCNDCDNCRTFCPDVSALREADGPFPGRRIDGDHCKGCGVCVEECPRGAMSMEEAQP